MYTNQYSSPLGDKLSKKLESTISVNLCAWSDLLGFSSHFTKNNWKLTSQEWQTVTNRLDDFYKIHSEFFSISNEYMFVLNDGVIKTYFPSEISESTAINVLHYVELWFRHIVQSHIYANIKEKKQGFPGARTVVAFGEKAQYTFNEVRIDDFVLNYTRPEERFSKIAQMTGNPVVISNPAQLQMNTALAKAYILDNLGSKKGINGASLYLDQSVLKFINELVSLSDSIKITKKQTPEGNLIALEYVENSIRPWVFGLLLEERIDIDEDIISTKVYKLKAYYPNDEHPDEFRFEL